MTPAEEILKKVRDIPPLPNVVMQILKLSNSPSASAKDLVEVMELDPGITAKVLRLCNSAFFGLPQKVTSLQTATVYLGLNEIINMVVMGCFNSFYSSPQPGYGLEKGELWGHSVAVALASWRLANRLNYHDPAAAFTAGLLHDLGKIVLHEYVHQESERIQSLIELHDLSFAEAEKKVIGMDHCEVGELVAKKWNLPENLQLAIRYHHAQELEGADVKIMAITHISNSICVLLSIGSAGQGDVVKELSKNALEIIQMTEDDLLSQSAEMIDDFKRATNLLKTGQ